MSSSSNGGSNSSSALRRKAVQFLTNVGGRGSFHMEAWKFAVYLLVPIGASVYFSNPGRMKQTAEYWKFIEYPPNPNVGLKDEIIAAQKQWQLHNEAYQKSLAELKEANKKRKPIEDNDETERSTPGFWRRWFGWGKGKE
jgi:hypothetical protein